MKTLLALLFLASLAAAQSTITVNRATEPLNTPPPQTVSVSPAAGGSSSASSTSSASVGAVVTGNGASFAEVPASEKTKKKVVVVPASLQSASINDDAGVDKQHTDAAAAALKPVGLHFDNLVDGTDPVSVTVRRFQMFCNSHNMAQDEIEVRDWVKANQNIVASSPSEMQRKQQYPLIREQLIGMKFPKDWFEPELASPAAAPSDSK